jgi:hypothetical protein
LIPRGFFRRKQQAGRRLTAFCRNATTGVTGRAVGRHLAAQPRTNLRSSAFLFKQDAAAQADLCVQMWPSLIFFAEFTLRPDTFWPRFAPHICAIGR